MRPASTAGTAGRVCSAHMGALQRWTVERRVVGSCGTSADEKHEARVSIDARGVVLVALRLRCCARPWDRVSELEGTFGGYSGGRKLQQTERTTPIKIRHPGSSGGGLNPILIKLHSALSTRDPPATQSGETHDEAPVLVWW